MSILNKDVVYCILKLIWFQAKDTLTSNETFAVYQKKKKKRKQKPCSTLSKIELVLEIRVSD